MNNKKLPVLVLKNIILFPHSEIRLELENDKDKELISLADSYYNKHILIIHPEDALEDSIDKTSFPRIGVIGYINMKLDLPNNRTRIVIRGLDRVKVLSFAEEIEGTKVSSFEEIKKSELSLSEQMAYSRSLIKQTEYYIEHCPNVSNSILSDILGVNDIDKITDILTMFIPGTYERKIEYLNETSATSRAMMLLDDINMEISVTDLEQEIEDRVSFELDKTQREYILNEKIKVMRDELGEGYDKDREIDSLKAKLNNKNLPEYVKKKLEVEIKRYEAIPEMSSEIGMLKTYIDTLLALPWGVYTEDNKDLNAAKEMLDSTHYGLFELKERIVEYLALAQMTNGLNNPIICFVGPPGVGKTTFAKSIADALGRKYIKISVGGVNDEADIVGHRRAYIGSSPGKIIDGIKRTEVANPVFVIDEIDKMTKDIKGDPASALLEVLDKEQNKYFVDHYIEEQFDLSKVMFILTANYIEKIPEELRDRLEIIEISSYTEYEKFNICKNYIIPNGIKKHGLENYNIVFTDEAIFKIIRNYTKEAGVRELERKVYAIFRKLIKKIVVEKQETLRIIDDGLIKDLLGNEIYTDTVNFPKESIGIVNGMSYTIYGGDILKIEVNFYEGDGKIITTGSLGDVFIESAKIALSYIKSNYKKFGIDYDKLSKSDIHIHVPEGAVKKDGPSAGITITTALISAFTDLKISSNISMTGEMTLRGDILPVGGLKEKIIGAKKAGVKKIFIPKGNEAEVKSFDKEITSGLRFIYVENYSQVFENLTLTKNIRKRVSTVKK
ncbi:MAG: endopeptidase La [Bacilli bacterium]|nr:endopeptidase La [Bacilli bacterium]